MLYWIEHIAVAGCAISGVLAAAGRKVDLFGVMVLATVTAFGGGTLRDVILGDLPVFWIRDGNYLFTVLVAAVFTFFAARRFEFPGSVLQAADAAGLALFTILGTRKAIAVLAARDGLDPVDVVAHSTGGRFTRAAMREVRAAGHPLRVASLVTIGTPWQGSFVAEAANGHVDMSVAAGDPRTVRIIEDFKVLLGDISEGAGTQVVSQYLGGPDGWNERQGDVLRDTPVTLIAGDWFQAEGGDPLAWPHDGLVQWASAMAHGVSPHVMTPVATHTFPDVHSIFFADQFGLPWHRALTWNPQVFEVVLQSIGTAS